MNQQQISIDEIAKEQVLTGTLAQRDSLILSLIDQLSKAQKEVEELKKKEKDGKTEENKAV